MKNKDVSYQIVKAGLTGGFYIDIYIGFKLFKTILANDSQDLGLKLDALVTQFKTMGLTQERI